jgi:hypothetical protein
VLVLAAATVFAWPGRAVDMKCQHEDFEDGYDELAESTDNEADHA